MSDLLTWSPIHLGRWFGTTVKVHVSLIVFVASLIVTAPFEPTKGSLSGHLEQAVAWTALFLLALAIHEAAHAYVASKLDCEQEDVHLWPLGSLVGPSTPPLSINYLFTVLAGPFASGAIALMVAAWLGFSFDAQFAWHPLGKELDAGAPWIQGRVKAEPMSAPWLIGWFGHVNYLLFLVNLLPALPFDGGRLFRWFLANTALGSSRESMAAPWTARATAAILFLVGMVRLLFGQRWDGLTIVMLAVLIELFVRSEARVMEDGGYFDDGLFGYDFSEGYTSLESGAAKVRPHRESALKRWRRRRSDQRRERRIMQEVAEERRMDEILDKIHREGRSSLTDEENRFLVRVSTRFRNRQNTQD
ncbi:site-2 protease family protein [Planctomyces sp. SH-PL62]|uniref:site-2 protease family protein n=1 Tax=Planctomyces sp. SH-PL62 TaxID=1636152 RepID=UPI00078C57F3|nr:site-2 protease family protein [Planctomyces sp. SH-PL62]AMV36781.1 Peptidase family M50 [Planctomyces sp. SH-PL62]